MRRFKLLLQNELVRIGRDNLMILFMVYPFVISLLGRYGVPYIQGFLMTKGFDLTPHYPVVVIFLILVNPYIYGSLAAFTILDEREDRVLEAIRITPIKIETYLTAKVAMIVVVSILTGIIVVPLVNLVQISFTKLIIVNVLMAFAAPFNMLLIASIAENKIEGFAITKGTGFMLILPLVAFYVPAKYVWFFGIAPGFWPAFSMATAISPNYGPLPYWLYAVIGLGYVLLLSKLLLTRFKQKLV